MKKLILLDANSLIHRAFHAIPPLTSPRGEPAGALYGLSGLLLKVCRDQRPDFAAAAFDRPEPTFRKETFADYKAQRPKAPDELVFQLKAARGIFRDFGIATFEVPGFEADDLIGTLVEKFKKEPELKIFILSGDLDTLQLVEDNRVVAEILKKGVSKTIIYDERAVEERYGLKPSQLPDYKGFVGDASDNIPGVKGLGPKTAAGLIRRFGTIQNIYRQLPPDDPVAKKVLPFEKEALFSRRLATIRHDAPIDPPEEDLHFNGLDEKKLTAAWNELGFQSLIKRLGGKLNKTNATNKETGALF
jgi:DNA polymerase-1